MSFSAARSWRLIRSVTAGSVMMTACGRLGFEGNDASVTGSDVDQPEDAPEAVPNDVPDDQLVRYPMDDDPLAGTVTAVPASYSVPCPACPASSTAGRVNGGYRFNGTGVFALQHPELVAGGPFTIAVWMVLGTRGSFEIAVSKPFDATSTLNTFSLGFELNDRLFWETVKDGGYLALTTPAPIADDAWHHVATRYDGLERTLFLDGELIQAATGGFDASELDLVVGADIDAGTISVPFTGVLDDLRIYQRALTDSEINALANP